VQKKRAHPPLGLGCTGTSTAPPSRLSGLMERARGGLDRGMEEPEGGCWRRQSGAAHTEEQGGCSSKTT